MRIKKKSNDVKCIRDVTIMIRGECITIARKGEVFPCEYADGEYSIKLNECSLCLTDKTFPQYMEQTEESKLKLRYNKKRGVS